MEIPDDSDKQRCRLTPTIQLLEELVYEVFLRLPAKSLARFRCISKGMCGMIDSSIFVKNHNKRRSVITERARSSYDDDDYALSLFQPGPGRLFSLNFDKHNNLNRATAINLNCTFAEEDMFSVSWSSNGILCFTKRIPNPRSYILWNPTNGTFRKVDCSSPLVAANHSMGYDYVNDDYKIIRLIDNKTETCLEVYSFRNDSWRKLHKAFPEGSIFLSRTRAVCISGVMHWLWARTKNSGFIAAFDLAKETFTSLPLPFQDKNLQMRRCHYTDFRGRISVTMPDDGSVFGAQSVWVMEKYGVESSWTKLYSIDHSWNGYYECIPTFYFPNGDRRLLCELHYWYWWDPEGNTFQRIEFTGPSYDQYIFTEAHVYVRNLVRLDQ